MTFESFENEEYGIESQYPTDELVDDDVLGLDMSNERLIGIDMRGADLSHADLSHSFIAGVNFAGANLAKASLEETTLIGVNFRKAVLSGAYLRDGRWISADVTGADFNDVHSSGLRSFGVNWSTSSIPPQKKPGRMVTPVIFMPLIMIAGLILSLILRWRFRGRE